MGKIDNDEYKEYDEYEDNIDEDEEEYDEEDDEDVEEDDEEYDDEDDDENKNTVCLPVHVIKDSYGNISSATSKFDDGTTYKFSKDEYSNIWYSEDEDKYFSNFIMNNNENQKADDFVDSERAKMVSIINSSLPACLDSLQQLEAVIGDSDISTIFVSSSLGSFFKGTGGIEKVQKKAVIIYTKYRQSIDSYKLGKNKTSELIKDFAIIRDNINTFYQQCINDLKYVFGEETICSIDPEIFDFQSVKFLDADSMLKSTTLRYNSLNRNSKELMNIINNSFDYEAATAANSALNTSIKSSKKILSARNQKQMDKAYDELLVNAITTGVDLVSSAISHYSSARELTNQLKEELEELKNSYNHDIANIEADEMRLFMIFKNLNDLFIPQANAFYHYIDSVMSKELSTLFNQVHLMQKLNQLQNDKEELNLKLNSTKNNIEKDKNNHLITSSKIEETELNLATNNKELKIEYRKGFFLTIWNIGILGIICLFLVPKFIGTDFKTLYSTIINNFHLVPDLIVQTSMFSKVVISISGGILLLNRIIQNVKWGKRFKTAKVSQKTLKTNLNELKKNLTNLEKQVKSNTQKQNKLSCAIEDINKEIKEICIDVPIETIKAGVVSHLSNIIKLLKVGKTILENKIDSDLLNPVNFPSIQDISISPTAINKIALLQKVSEKVLTDINKEIVKNEQDINAIDNQVNLINQDMSLQQDELQVQNEELQVQNEDLENQKQKLAISNKIIKLEKTTVEAVSKILVSKIALNDKQKQGRMAAKEYNKALKDIKSQFKNQLKDLDNQADVLNEALKNVNLANNHDDSLQALTELVQDTDIKITKQDIEDMLAGKKTITI